MTQICNYCKLEKDINEFHKKSTNKNGYSLRCKECKKLSSVKYYENNKYKIKEYQLKYNYGLTKEQYEQMLITQDGKCAICNKIFNNKKAMHVDHNHKTGKIRQLLCQHCNTAIAFLNEDISILSRAIDYLNKWNQ